MEIVIASKNLGKIREFREMLKSVPNIDALSLMDFANYTPPLETGDTFEENATLKALHAAQTLGKTVLADDSGLVVPTLKGAPGVCSARYAGEDATDKENRQKLLKELEGKEDLDRSAYFECCLVLATPDGVAKKVTARCEGMIIHEEKGRQGFGYDPIFLKHDYEKTFAELSDDVKGRISHRGKAFEMMSSKIESLAREHTEFSSLSK